MACGARFTCPRCLEVVAGLTECDVLADALRFYTAWLCERCRCELNRVGMPPHATGRVKGRAV